MKLLVILFLYIHSLYGESDLDFSIGVTPTCSQLVEHPTYNFYDGLQYIGITDNSIECEAFFYNYSDLTFYHFILNNQIPNSSCGYCYFNLKNEIIEATELNTYEPNTLVTSPVTKLEDTAPYLDELEQINLDIKAQLELLNENSNLYNQSFLNELTNIRNSLLLNDFNQNSSGGSNPSLNNLVNKELEEKEDLNDIANDYTDTSDIDLSNSINNFNTEYESSLENVFSSYSNVFGFGGYGNAPSPIRLNIFGKSYVLFDVSILNEYISLIRNIFTVCAYLFGLFLVFKGV